MMVFHKEALVVLSVFLLYFENSLCMLERRSIDPDLQKAIDSYIENIYLPKAGIFGLGLAIGGNDGEILYTTGYGMANQEKGIPIGNNSQFMLGSSTKSFTNTVVVKVLHEKFPEMGESVLDTPIIKLLPQADFVLYDRYRTEHATFRDLMAHRLCLFREDYQFIAEAINSTAELVYRTRYNQDVCPIRTEFQYNNQMVILSSELAATLAGKPFIELAQDLMKEIGMVDSDYIRWTDDIPNMPFRTQPYYVLENVAHPMNTDLVKNLVAGRAAGGLFSTPNDMAKFLRFHLNFGKVNGKQIIPEECIKWMRTPANLIGNSFFSTMGKTYPDERVGVYYGYGLGLMMGTYDGWEHFHHGGSMPPYSTLISLFPSQNLTIFTSTNMGPLKVKFFSLHNFIFDLITGREDAMEYSIKSIEIQLKKKKEEERMAAQALEDLIIRERKADPSRSAPQSSLIGKYGSGLSGDVEIRASFNDETNSIGLFLTYGKWMRGWLQHIAGSLYKIQVITDVTQIGLSKGIGDGMNYCLIGNKTVEFVMVQGDEIMKMGKFKLGESLANLPKIPWNRDSCYNSS